MATVIELAKQVKQGEAATALEAQLQGAIDVVEAALLGINALRLAWSADKLEAQNLTALDGIRDRAVDRLKAIALR